MNPDVNYGDQASRLVTEEYLRHMNSHPIYNGLIPHLVPEYIEQLICAAGTYQMEPHDRCDLETWPWDDVQFYATHMLGISGRIKELQRAASLFMSAVYLVNTHKVEMHLLPSLQLRIKTCTHQIAGLLIEEKRTIKSI